MNALNNWINRFFKLEEINGDDLCPTYLFRWTLFATRWFKIYLHHFVGDDWSRDLHDHPKRFITIGLKGSYIEETPGNTGAWYHHNERIWKAPWIRSFPATHAHRLRQPPGTDCWTIAIVFRPVRKWGFWHQGMWVYWRDYVGGIGRGRKSCE